MNEAHLIAVTQAALRAMEEDQGRVTASFLVLLQRMRNEREELRHALQGIRIHYRIQGDHTHARVYVNGALSGRLCFRNCEFEPIRAAASYFLKFSPESLTEENQIYDNDQPPAA